MGKALLIGTAVAAGLYLLATGALFIMQRRLIYPATLHTAANDLFGFEDVRLRTPDGLALRAIFRPAEQNMPTLVFFHGNGDSLRGAEAATRMLGGAGYGLLLPEYRGYGGNPGAPTEAGLYNDGRAALNWLRARGVPLQTTVLLGNSLGSGVATQVASEREVGGLVVIFGFTSLADVAAEHMRLFPVRLLLRDRYDNLAKLRLLSEQFEMAQPSAPPR
jgi:fermentation-respiration switch protein FrsA (DUF1100 family)